MTQSKQHAGVESQPSVTTRLAKKICQFDQSMITPQGLQQARMCILDTIGVTLAGIVEPCVQILLDVPGIASSPGNALLLGTAQRTSALDAALINGTASHALDYDDFSAALGGHHSVPLVSTLLALSSERKVTGRQMIAAYIIGVETEIRLARAVNYHHYDKGWHPTSTLGTLGATAAACHLMGLSAEQTAAGLGIAASLASGIKANFGTMTKPLHIGHCARNGLLASLLAERGFDSAPNALEHHQGFFNVFNGPGTFDISRLFDGWGEPWEITADTIGLKQFPCCGSTHPAIAMALSLRATEGFNIDELVSIEIMPHGRRLRHTNTPWPQSALDAKFSVQYVVARALLSGSPRLRDFEGQPYLEPGIQRLLEITTTSAHPDMADDAQEQWGAEVILTMKDGTRIAQRVDNLVGRGGDNAMTTAELWEKFSDCAARTLPREQIAPLFERLETLESLDDIGVLMRLLETKAMHRRTPAKVKFAHRDEHDPEETTWVP